MTPACQKKSLQKNDRNGRNERTCFQRRRASAFSAADTTRDVVFFFLEARLCYVSPVMASSFRLLRRVRRLLVGLTRPTVSGEASCEVCLLGSGLETRKLVREPMPEEA